MPQNVSTYNGGVLALPKYLAVSSKYPHRFEVFCIYIVTTILAFAFEPICAQTSVRPMFGYAISDNQGNVSAPWLSYKLSPDRKNVTNIALGLSLSQGLSNTISIDVDGWFTQQNEPIIDRGIVGYDKVYMDVWSVSISALLQIVKDFRIGAGINFNHPKNYVLEIPYMHQQINYNTHRSEDQNGYLVKCDYHFRNIGIGASYSVNSIRKPTAFDLISDTRTLFLYISYRIIIARRHLFQDKKTNTP